MTDNLSPPIRTCTMAIVSLIFGILSWVAFPFAGALVAIITGHLARSEIRKAPIGTIEGDGMALAGLILGYVQLILAILFVAIIFLFLGGLAFFASQPPQQHTI